MVFKQLNIYNKVMQGSGTFIFSTTDLPLDTSGNQNVSDFLDSKHQVDQLIALSSLGLAKEP